MTNMWNWDWDLGTKQLILITCALAFVCLLLWRLARWLEKKF